MTRRRNGDNDWEYVKQRKSPFDDPSTDWGRNIEDRVTHLEADLQKNNELTQQTSDNVAKILLIFNGSKRLGLVAIGILAFLGWSGVIAIWNFIKEHIK